MIFFFDEMMGFLKGLCSFINKFCICIFCMVLFLYDIIYNILENCCCFFFGYVEIDVYYEVLDFDYIVDMKLDN